MLTEKNIAWGLLVNTFIASSAFAGGGVHWDHKNPASWGGLSHDYETCSTGLAQSPVDISANGAIDAEPVAFEINWASFTPEVVNNGHTIQANTGGNAGHTPMEVHFVHQSEAGDLLVVGVLINEGKSNPNISVLWDTMPTDHGEAMAKQSVDPADLLPSDDAAYRYKGSLTTPPCTEIVTWHVMKDPITMSAEQIGAFKAMYPANYRPVQELNRRYILVSD